LVLRHVRHFIGQEPQILLFVPPVSHQNGEFKSFQSTLHMPHATPARYGTDEPVPKRYDSQVLIHFAPTWHS
jgi:hypothetical protein